MRKFGLCLVAAMLFSSLIFALWEDEQKVIASDGTQYDDFGRAVSISGDYAIIGAPGDDYNGLHPGSAYIFYRDVTGWSEQQKLLPDDPGDYYDHFGQAVSISGDYAVVGVDWDDDNGNNSGSAYVFHRSGTTWTQHAKLLASDGDIDDHFGCAVAISGDYIIVGASGDDDDGSLSGSAYIFHRTDSIWVEVAKLTASDADEEDYFGHSVSIDGDYTVVGAMGDDDNGENSGSIYIFNRSERSWSEQVKLTAFDGEFSAYFGKSVSISGNYALAGAYYNAGNGETISGAAYLFYRTGVTWELESKLLPSDGENYDYFGKSVSISGEYAVIGADVDDDNDPDSGSAYVFHGESGGNWVEQAKLLASDGATGDEFGRAVSISGNYALIGAWEDDDNGYDSGSAYFYYRGESLESPVVSISIELGNVNLDWDVVPSATSYKVYSYSDPYEPVENWTFEAEVTEENWSEAIPVDTKKFYYVVAVN